MISRRGFLARLGGAVAAAIVLPRVIGAAEVRELPKLIPPEQPQEWKIGIRCHEVIGYGVIDDNRLVLCNFE